MNLKASTRISEANLKHGRMTKDKLAEQGVAEAQYNLGLMYYKGEGVIQDYVYAHMWWNIATANGNDIAKSLFY